ncbi:1052_t:CDS:2, partial [Gigaspora margarita]
FGSTYPLAFALVCSKTCDFYCWIIQQLNKVLMILTGDAQVATIIINRELALMLAISLTWLPYKESWLGAYTNNNINLDIKSIQHVESLHSKLKGIENCIIPINKLLSVLWRQLQEHSQKLLYKTFLYQNRHIQDKIDIGLKELYLIYSRFAFELYIRQQGDFVESYKYKIFAPENNTYNVLQITNRKKSTYIVYFEALSMCTYLYPIRTRTQYLYICVPQSEVHQYWYIQHIVKTNYITNSIPPLAIQIFKQLPECHYDTFSDLMQYALNYVLENGKVLKVPELLYNETNIIQQTTYETINIENVSDSNEDKENVAHLKKTKAMQKLDKNNKILCLSNINIDPYVPQDAILQIHNPIGYDVNRLTTILSYIMPGRSSQEYWFYSPECAQLASDTFNMLVIVFEMNTAASIFFLLFKQKPGLHKRLIILQWHGSNHIVLVKLKPNRSVQTLSLNSQYAPICSHLDLPKDWLALFV